MHPERADGEGPERALVLGHPVDVGQLFPLPARLIEPERLGGGRDGRFDQRRVAVAEDVDAPRPVARNLAARDDEAFLAQPFFQQGFPARALGGRSDKTRLAYFAHAHAGRKSMRRGGKSTPT